MRSPAKFLCFQATALWRSNRQDTGGRGGANERKLIDHHQRSSSSSGFDFMSGKKYPAIAIGNASPRINHSTHHSMLRPPPEPNASASGFSRKESNDGLGNACQIVVFYAIELPLDHEWAIARSRTRLFTPRSNERVLKTEEVTMPVQTKKVIRGIVAVGVSCSPCLRR